LSASEYQFAPSERPLFPGSPFAPHHSWQQRVSYAVWGLLLGSASTFTNALVNVNVGSLAGSLGLTLAQALGTRQYQSFKNQPSGLIHSDPVL